MEHTPDIIPAKELDRSFTIPKRKNQDAQQAETPADLYSKAYCQQNQSLSTSRNASTTNKYNNQNISAGDYWNIREEPKTPLKRSMTYRDTFKDLNDDSLPKELKMQFQPLYCKLCTAQLSSNVNAKVHYNSKNHDKKVRNFLIEYAAKTGEPLHKRARTEKTDKGLKAETGRSADVDPRHFYCEICDLPLTGKCHAESHYMGKNHQKVLSGKRAPAGKGYYTDQGQWIRTISAKSDETGRDGFGQDFILTRTENINAGQISSNSTCSNSTLSASLKCDLCQVAVTSTAQMEMHMQGQKHSKKVKSLAASGQSGNDTIKEQDEKRVANSINLLPTTGNLDVYSAHRTPSGQFYCKNCDTTSNSEKQFTNHISSKKHLSKVGNKTKTLPN